MMKKILALGAENKTCFTVIDGDNLFISKPVMDLGLVDNYNYFEGQIDGYLKQCNISPDIIACDLHPDYRSTYLAEFIARKKNNSRLIRVQHHHAHLASCMMEHCLFEKVIGVSFDGTGFGTDGNSWGGEFFVLDRKEFKREYHLKYIPVPGGDIAAKEMWRMGYSYLFDVYGSEINDMDLPLLKRIEENKQRVLSQMILKRVNSPLSSSMGRLFDAVSAITGLCITAEFEAEGPILLEKEAEKGEKGVYQYELTSTGEVDVSPMIRGIVNDMAHNITTRVISAKFHNSIVEIIYQIAEKICFDTGIDKVIISGGCFMNKYLTEHLEEKMKDSGLTLYKHKELPPTDLCISTGQAVVASSLGEEI